MKHHHQHTAQQRSSAAHEHATQRVCEVATLSVDVLARRSLIESEQFYRGQPHDPQFAYELFRRAIVDANQAAWAHIYQQYNGQVERWVRRTSAFHTTGEACEVFVNEAFLRFYRAITPARFGDFPTLATLLHYLQRCASCVVIDAVRTQAVPEVLSEEVLLNVCGTQSVDEQVIDQLGKVEFWRCIDGLLHTEAERAVIFFSFIQGMKPSAIRERRADLFDSVQEVYAVKRNVLERLGRNQQLAHLFGPA